MMKSLIQPFIVAMVLATWVDTTCAQISVVSNLSSVSAAGSAGGVYDGTGVQSYTQSATSTSITSGTLAATGNASWVDAQPHGQIDRPSQYSSTSSAGLSWTIGGSTLWISSYASASSLVSLWGPYGPVSAVATSVIDLDISVPSPSAYSLDISTLFFGRMDFGFSITALSDGHVITNPYLPAFTYSGVLMPGLYHLNLHLNADASVADPLGTDSTITSNIKLTTATVPDAVPTGWVLAMGSLVIFLMHWVVCRNHQGRQSDFARC